MQTNTFAPSAPTIGGKTKLLPLLLPIIESSIMEHSLVGLIDGMAGGNKVVPNVKRYLPYRLVNDLDKGFASFAAILTDRGKLLEFIETAYRLQADIQTKEQFEWARKTRRSPDTDMVLAAALTIIVQKYSRAGDRKTFWPSNVERGISLSYLERFKELHPIMQNVTVTSEDYRLLIDLYKNRDDFFTYLDVPYYGADCYEDGFPDWMHEELPYILIPSKNKIMISNFDCPYYDVLLKNGWYKYSLGTISKSSSGKKGRTQEEFIWTNYKIKSYMLGKGYEVLINR